MAGPAPQDQGGDKNTYYIIWVLLLIVGIAGGIWYFFSEQLKSFFIFVKTYEILGMSYIVSPFAKFNIPLINTIQSNLSEYLDITRRLTPATINLEIAETLSTAVGEYLRYLMIPLLLFLMYYTYKRHILMRCTITHNMKTLLSQEAEIWPQIDIVKNLNLIDQDLESGPWAMAMTPMQFAKKYKLIQVEFAELVGSQFSKIERPEFKLTLIRSRAERAFVAQLGRSWQRVEVMPPHRRAIFAVLAARVGRDTKVSHNMIAQLGRSASTGTPNYKGIDELLNKHIKNPIVQKIINKHAYEFTVFAALLLAAREDGVVASADFLWIKPVDRRLWYVLNNVGRQTPAVEVGGIFSHWYTELALKRPLSVPDVAGAVDALELALGDVIYIPDEKEREELLKQAEDKRIASKTPSDAEASQT